MYGEGVSKEGGLLDVGVAMDTVTKTGPGSPSARPGSARVAGVQGLPQAEPADRQEIDSLIRAKIAGVPIPVEGIAEA